MIISLVSDFIVFFSISTKIFFTFEWRRCSSWSRFFSYSQSRPYSKTLFSPYCTSIYEIHIFDIKVMNMNTKLFIMNI